jgi:hypothetical protein
MTTHMGYLPDIELWFFRIMWGIVVIGIVWFIWLRVQATQGGKG